MKSSRAFSRALPVWPKKLTGRMNIWVSFHALVTMPKGEGGVLRVAAAQAYRVWVNGRLAGRGPARTAHHHARVDEWAVWGDPNGALRVIIEVMAYGVPTFCSTDEPAFCCAELVTGGKALVWTAPRGGGFAAEHRAERVQKVERYSYQRAFLEAYRFDPRGLAWLEPGYSPARSLAIARVAHRRTWLPRGVALPDLSVVKPHAGAVKGGTRPFSAALAATAPRWGHLFDVPKTSKGYRLDQIEWTLFRTLAGTTFASSGRARIGGGRQNVLQSREWLRADFGSDLTGFPALRVTARRATRLVLLFDEILVDGQVKFNRSGCMNALWLELKAGTSLDFEAFEPYTLRFLQVLVWNGEAEVSNLRLRRYESSVALRGAPARIGTAEARVRKAALATFRQNALDIFMDCPARERAGWLCDSLFTARAEWHLTGDNAIERAFLENYLRPATFDGLPRGMVPMCYPAEPLGKCFIPNWAMFFVIQLDEAARLRRLPSSWRPLMRRRVRGLLAYFRRFENEGGLLEKLESWIFVEWSKANEFVKDVNYPSNMLYAMMLRAAARLLGDRRLAERAGRVEEAVRAESWRDGRFVDNAVRDPEGRLVVTENATEVCQYYAFFTGVASPRREKELWRRLVRADYGALHPANVFVGKLMRLQLLVDNGEHAAARRELMKSYLPMARATGTLWEVFQANASCNHGFTSYVAVLIDRLCRRSYFA
jgi:alpha-L-rhamnosidase